MMKTSTLLALSLAGLAATAGLACFVIVSAPDAPSAIIAGGKERAASGAPATVAITRLVPVPEQSASPSPPSIAKKADALSLSEPRVEPSEKATKKQSLPHVTTENTENTEDTEKRATPSVPSVPSVVKNKTDFGNKSLPHERPYPIVTTEHIGDTGKRAVSTTPTVPPVNKTRADLEKNKTLPKEHTEQTATLPAPRPPQSLSNSAAAATPASAKTDAFQAQQAAPLPSNPRPWPKGNFTPAQERYRAQYGWQSFSEAIVAEAKEEIAR